MSALKIENFIRKALIFFLFLLDCGYTLERLTEAVLTSTHNLCLGAKLRKIGMPLHSPVFLYKSGVWGGILFMDMFSWWLIYYIIGRFKTKTFNCRCLKITPNLSEMIHGRWCGLLANCLILIVYSIAAYWIWTGLALSHCNATTGDYFATKIDNINTTFTVSRCIDDWTDIYATNPQISV